MFKLSKPFGIICELKGYNVKSLSSEAILGSDYQVEIGEGKIAIGFNSIDEEPEAVRLIESIASSNSYTLNTHITYRITEKWRRNSSGDISKHHLLEVHDSISHIKVKAMGYVLSTEGNARVLKLDDSDDALANKSLINKAHTNTEVLQALAYYNDALEDKVNPYPHLYKCIEAMLSATDRDSAKLAALAGEPKSYVERLKSTCDYYRHHQEIENNRQLIPKSECFKRVQDLIKFYTESLK